MTEFASARPGFLARLLIALSLLVGLGSCSGGVTPVVVDPERVTILPDTAILYSGLPTTFVISGGTGAYVVTSSNQAAVEVSGGVRNGALVVVPNYVLTDQTVTLTVRDTGTAPIVTATLTVRPNPVANNITITPSGTQGGTCAPALCSGGDAVVTATISQGGIPLPARAVRLSVVSGDALFIVSPPGTTEVLATSVDVITDELGKVSARLRALPDAPNQTVLIQVTDLGTGAFQRATFLVSQATGGSPGFFVTPTSITFSGRFTGQCANNLSAVFFVIGGVPPYTILNTAGDAFTVSENVVNESGGSFAVTARGVCTGPGGLPIVVRDSAGRTSTVTVANLEGTTEPTDIQATPDEVTIASCSATASVTLAGGTGSYFASSGSNAVTVTGLGATRTIARRTGSGVLPDPTDVLVGFSDGRTTTTVTVHLVGEGATGPGGAGC